MTKKLKLGIWTICQSPDCNNTNNPDHIFLAPYETKHRDRKFCSVKCAAIIRSNTPEFKKAAGEKLRQANKVRHFLHPEWDKNNKDAVSKMMVNRNRTPEMRKVSGITLAEANRNRKELYPEWHANQRKAVSNMFQDTEFLAAHKVRSSKVMTNLHKDPEFIARHDKRASETFLRLWQDTEFAVSCSERSRETFIRLHQDPEFCRLQREAASKAGHENIIKYNKSEKGRTTSSKNMREKVMKLLQDPDFVTRRDKRASETFLRLNKDPEFCKKRDEAVRENMMRKLQNGGFDYGCAQRMLFSQLPGLYPLLKEYLHMEKIVYLTDDIVNRYPGSNKRYYSVDIAYITDDQIKLAIEVDGSWGHSTDEDVQRDKVRDSILLNEFGIKTIRVTNNQVFRDVDEVANLIVSEIQSSQTRT